MFVAAGIARPGEVTAILGSSGAGKTTLLDILAGRKNTGNIKGDILVNGHKMNLQQFKYVSAYVMQDDILLGSLTTRESLEFTARLRAPKMPRDQIAARVTDVLKDMALEEVAESFVGSESRRGLSGVFISEMIILVNLPLS